MTRAKQHFPKDYSTGALIVCALVYLSIPLGTFVLFFVGTHPLNSLLIKLLLAAIMALFLGQIFSRMLIEVIKELRCRLRQ